MANAFYFVPVLLDIASAFLAKRLWKEIDKWPDMNF